MTPKGLAIFYMQQRYRLQCVSTSTPVSLLLTYPGHLKVNVAKVKCSRNLRCISTGRLSAAVYTAGRLLEDKKGYTSFTIESTESREAAVLANRSSEPTNSCLASHNLHSSRKSDLVPLLTADSQASPPVNLRSDEPVPR